MFSTCVIFSAPPAIKQCDVKGFFCLLTLFKNDDLLNRNVWQILTLLYKSGIKFLPTYLHHQWHNLYDSLQKCCAYYSSLYEVRFCTSKQRIIANQQKLIHTLETYHTTRHNASDRYLPLWAIKITLSNFFKKFKICSLGFYYWNIIYTCELLLRVISFQFQGIFVVFVFASAVIQNKWLDIAWKLLSSRSV